TAATLLTPDGVFAMYNYYREDWLIDRLGNTLLAEFGPNLCVIAPQGVSGLAMLAAGDGVSNSCPAGAKRDLVAAPPAATDDYPFLYVREPGIPLLYLATIASILAISLLTVK